MQVTELANEGLKRAYTITVPAGEIASQRDKRLAALARDLRMPGFRPGKVPMGVVKQRYGAAVMGEVLEQSVNDATRQVVSDRGLKPALQPKIEVTNFAEGGDLEFRVDVEVLPEVPVPDLSGIEVERLKAEPGEEQISKTLETIASRNRTLEDVAEARPAAKGEVVVADFTGRLVPDLLGEGRPFGVVAGTPGRLPESWEAAISEGLDREVVATGTEDGLPWFDLRVHGTATAPGHLRVFLHRPNGIPSKAGAVLTLSLHCRLAGGTLPEGLRSQLGFNARSADAFLKAILAPVAAPEAGDLAGGKLSATVTLPDDQAVAFARPYAEFVFPKDVAVDFTLRIGPARAFEGAEAPEPVAFPGGSATDMPIEIGGGGFIPGFAEQIEGISPGETREIAVTFPPDYGAAELAGREALFTITAKGLKRPVDRPVDDDLAKSLGFDDLNALKEQVRQSLQREYDALSRLRVKRALLDKLAERADFPVPEGMVEAEFAQIWQRVEADMKAGRLDEEDQGKDEAALKADYRAIAERRIRLGLLLSEIGRTNNIQVASEELARAMRQEAARYPGQEKQVMEFFRKNPQATEGLRAPIFEEKVVDFMLELARVSERQIPPEELTAPAAA